MLTLAWSRLEPFIANFSGQVSLAYLNFSSGEQLSIQAKQVMRSASLIKLPILLAALQAVDEKKLDLDQRYPLQEQDIVGGSGILQSLDRGLHLTFKDILTLMIIVSDNSATNMAIDIVGLEAINSYLEHLGLTQTCLVGKLQLPVAQYNTAQRQGQRNHTSAGDMLKLLTALYHADRISPSSQQLALDILKRQVFTEAIGRYILGGDHDTKLALTLASKSGALAGLWHDAALIYGHEDYALVIMTDDSDDLAEHWEQEGMMLIAELSREIYQSTRENHRQVV